MTMDLFFAIGVGLLAVLIIGIVNGLIIEEGKVAPFINNDVFRGFIFIFMDRRLTTYLRYCFDISIIMNSSGCTKFCLKSNM